MTTRSSGFTLIELLVVVATSDNLKVDISFENNQLKIDLYDKGVPAIPTNIRPRNIEDIKPGGFRNFFYRSDYG